ncbi:MAG: hypothetical protein IT379_24300 [Deltaproteobacteria bacterium]|nr:hypothetical protein [Deltaproteobacteria bacterium]
MVASRVVRDRVAAALVFALFVAACGDDDDDPFDGGREAAPPPDSGGGEASTTDAGPRDAGLDAGAMDAASGDAGALDLGALDGGLDATPVDAGTMDSGFEPDAPPLDAGPPDTGPPDAGPPDAGPPDTGPPDTGPPPARCVSGATGTHVVRFGWLGSGAGSTAYVDYEANDLPDTSRWHVGAYAMSIGYRPVFDDIFLGEGGLDLEGTAFIDVELSTAGLSSIRSVTLAIYGRSFATTASGSFSWQTFDGIGATPTDSVSNVAPYAWYFGDATLELPPGDSGVLLRIRAGPSSDALIVNRVEICFDAS